MARKRGDWKPNHILRLLRGMGTSTRTLNVMTDAGEAYVKAINNPEGPHALAREWVATNLAKEFGLRTFDCSILDVIEANDLPFDNTSAAPGPAFATRAEEGRTWGGEAEELEYVQDSQDLTRLIVFDTWIRNRDRYSVKSGEVRRNTDNVFLSTERLKGGLARVVAMDFSHCIAEGELNPRVAHIDAVKDDQIYGAFPEFAEYFDESEIERAQGRAFSISPATIEEIVRTIPSVWQVNRETQAALVKFLTERAQFIAQLPIEAFRPRKRRDGD